MNIKIEIYEKFNNQLEEIWTQIQKDSEITVFQSYEWLEELFKIFSKNKLLPIIVCIFEDNIPKAIIPFEIKKKNFCYYLCWFFQDKIDFTFPIVKKNFFLNATILNNIFNLIIKKYPMIDAIFLDKQLENINSYENPYVKLLKNKFHSNSYKIRLPITNKKYETQVLKKSFLVQNNRKKKILKKYGKLKFKTVKSNQEKIKLLQILLENKKIRYFRVKKKVFNINDKFFFESLINNKNLNIHLSYLKINENFLSIHYGIIFRETYNYYIISNIRSVYERYSPGRLLIHFLIRFCIKKKFSFFDFLLGDENYKKNWSNEINKIFYYIKVIKLKGWLNFYILKRILRNFFIKKLLKKTQGFGSGTQN